ncbi:ROK family protein [Spiroplasma endosymbiont of Othius punctulatus]|uniref:ROK family protein n=1 Tax=Spiroplasma endosymbiont of Othius punctulatus TaxID=3066289 RepID=UPI0030D07C65
MNIMFDVGGTGTKVIAFRGNEIKNESYITYERKSLIEPIKLKDLLDKICEYTLKFEEKINIGIAFPGPVDTIKKNVIGETTFIDIDIDIEKYLKDKNKNIQSIFIENDAKAAAYGELVYGRNNKVKNLVHLTVGSGLGMGVIINGELYRGSTFNSTEISRTYSNISKNNDDQINAVNTGLGAVIYKYQIMSGTDSVDGKGLFEKYNSGDEIVKQIFDEWLTSLAKTIVNIHLIFDADLITIGGGVSANEQFMSELKEKVKQYTNIEIMGRKLTLNQNIEKVLQTSKLKNKAACYGMLAIMEENKNE